MTLHSTHMKYVFITGASSGIGYEFARSYAKLGRSLILVARSKDKLSKLAAELREKYDVTVHILAFDLAKVDAAEKLFKTYQALKVQTALLINNAGVGLIGEFAKEDINLTQEMIFLNVLNLTKLTYLFLPELKKNQGNIINVASVAGFHAIPYMASYSGTKAYVKNFSMSLSTELKDCGVHVLTLAPGPTDTNFFNNANFSLQKSRLSHQSAKQVVKEAINGLTKKKILVIPGIRNKLNIFFSRFLTHECLGRITRYFLRH